MNNPPPERRKAFRPPFLSLSQLISCEIKVNSRRYPGILRDMSLCGLFVKLDDPGDVPEISASCEVIITLQGKESRLRIDRLHGRVVRDDDQGVAVSFDAPMEWFAVVSGFLFNTMMECNSGG